MRTKIVNNIDNGLIDYYYQMHFGFNLIELQPILFKKTAYFQKRRMEKSDREHFVMKKSIQ